LAQGKENASISLLMLASGLDVSGLSSVFFFKFPPEQARLGLTGLVKANDQEAFTVTAFDDNHIILVLTDELAAGTADIFH